MSSIIKNPDISSIADDSTVYLTSFFREPNGRRGVHLAWSNDGFVWDEIGDREHTWLKSNIYPYDAMRDPFLTQDKNGIFHLIWTTEWSSQGIGYSSSTDLINWTNPKWLGVMEWEPKTLNTWAPELFYDDKNGVWVIFWSSTIKDKFSFCESALGRNHRIYYTTTKDFVSFAETKLLFDPGYTVIDATMAKIDEKIYMFFKNETRVGKTIHYVTSDTPYGPWSAVSNAISEKGKMVEGPSVLIADDKVFIYCDYFKDHIYGASMTTDMKEWQIVTDKISMPDKFRHASMLSVKASVIKRLYAQLGGCS